MANFEHRSAAATTINLIVTSGDPQASGTAGDFEHPVRRLHLAESAHYQVALAEISFTHPGGSSVYVSTSLAAPSRVGSQTANIIYRVPDMPAGPIDIHQTSSLVQWFPLDGGLDTIDRIEMKLTTSTGNVIPNVGFTTATLVIRRAI